MQLSGGWEVLRLRDELVLRRAVAPADDVTRALVGEVTIGRWQFRPGVGEGAWTAALPADRSLWVRPWRYRDRIAVSGKRQPRRVKRFLYEAGIPGVDRQGWPVVLADDEIVWIPGVGRSDAATVRSGRPVVHYLCDRIGG